MRTGENLKILIIGAGWAGLSCALQLAEQNHHITILEAAPQAGGRARSINFGEDIVDNGQHLLIGAYSNFLNLLRKLNIPEQTVLKRIPFHLQMLQSNSQSTQTALSLKLEFPKLPSPLHLIMGFFNAKGLSFTEYLAITKFWQLLRKINFQLSEDITIKTFLHNANQPISLIKNLWGPLALAALSTPIEKASAKVFLRVLKEVFNQKRHQTDYLFAKCDLSELFSKPALNFLKTRGHEILCSKRVTELVIEKNQCIGVKTNNQYFEADTVILATPPKVAAKLLQSHTTCSNLYENLYKFTYQPITTVYLKYSNPIQFKTPMIGFIDSLSHWIFDRGFSGNPKILSVIITGEGEHLKMTQEELLKIVSQEIKCYDPNLGNPIDYKVITDKQAAFSCEVGIESMRPSHITPVSNLFLAGDYTQTGYPATLEGAILSGIIVGADLCVRPNL